MVHCNCSMVFFVNFSTSARCKNRTLSSWCSTVELSDSKVLPKGANSKLKEYKDELDSLVQWLKQILININNLCFSWLLEFKYFRFEMFINSDIFQIKGQTRTCLGPINLYCLRYGLVIDFYITME